MTASPYGATASAIDLDVADVEGVVREAGTPLSDLADAAPEEGEDDGLEQLTAHVVLDTGESWDVLIVNRDFVAWDMTRGKKKWPAAEDAPFLLNTFLAHAASKRAGHFAGGLDEFSNRADVVKVRRAGSTARPTRAGAGPASS